MSSLDTLVQASRLYYELGETQGQIAELLGVTRPQVSRLLKQARAEGVVEIRIIDRTSEDSPAGEVLRGRFGLRAVHLAPSLSGPEDLTRRSIARLAAQVLRSEVRDGAVVGLGDGASMSATADAVADVPAPIAATVVPLCGGYWFAGPTREPFRRIADALGAGIQGLLVPGLVDDAATKRALVAHAGVRRVLELWDRLDMAMVGIGAHSWTDATFGGPVGAALGEADAVGEILIAPFDLRGRFVAGRLRERVIAFDARELGRIPIAIGVAGGPSKVRPVLGALRAGVLNTLVTDVRTAEAVLALDGTAT
ncbi:MAG TPA: sugar-binding domain-containing protein [Candidatus Limnocylindrales bacterium]